MMLLTTNGRHQLRGMGDAATDSKIAGFTLSTGASVGTAVAASTGALAGAAGALGISTGVLTAGIGAAVAGVTLLIDHLIANSGCGQTCIVASDYADQAEALLKQNLAAWNSEAHTEANQAQALANYDALWAKLVQLCSDSSLGNAGQRCISDRSRNGKYPWAVYYRDPIADATDVVSSVEGSDISAVVSSVNPLLVMGGIAAALFFLVK